MNAGITIALSFSIRYTLSNTCRTVDALINGLNRLKAKRRKSNIKMKTVNHFELERQKKELEKQKEEMNRASTLAKYLAECSADREDMKPQVNATQLEKQKREMDHDSTLAIYLAKYNADREGQRHLFDATITLAGHALKSAILINGGAAVGMLTFIGNELVKLSQSRSAFALSLFLYVIGVLVAAMAAGFSYLAQDGFMENNEPDFIKYLRKARVSIIFSYGLFILSSLIACWGFANYDPNNK